MEPVRCETPTTGTISLKGQVHKQGDYIKIKLTHVCNTAEGEQSNKAEIINIADMNMWCAPLSL